MYMWQSLTKLLRQYFAMAILGPTTKFNSCQYFQLCHRLRVSTSKSYIITSFLSNYRSRSTFPLAVKWSSTSGGCAQTRRSGTSGAWQSLRSLPSTTLREGPTGLDCELIALKKWISELHAPVYHYCNLYVYHIYPPDPIFNHYHQTAM